MGLVLGVVAGVSTQLPLVMRVAVGVAGVVVLIGLEFAGRVDDLPQNGRLVPEHVALNGSEGIFQFGFEMGTGVRTYVTSSVPYLLVLSVALAGSLSAGVVAGAAFGVGRFLLAVTRLSFSEDSDQWATGMSALSRPLSILSSFVFLLLGGLALSVA